MSAVAMAACADCGAMTPDDDLYRYGAERVCEPCGDVRDRVECAGCKDAFDEGDLEDVDGDLLCAACVEARADDDDCTLCGGTGIGQRGDPDTSTCHQCGGGVRRPGRDPDAAYDNWRDRDFA